MQKAFVNAFLVAKSGAEAARIAGYSHKTAVKQSTRLLTNGVIRRAVALAWELRAHRAGLSKDLIFTFLADVINADIRDFVEWDEEGNETHKASADLTYQQARLLQGRKSEATEYHDKHGGIIRTTRRAETILMNKMEAIKRAVDVLFLAQSDQDKADQGLGELTRGWMSSIAHQVGEGGRRAVASDTNGQARRLPDKKQTVEATPVLAPGNSSADKD